MDEIASTSSAQRVMRPLLCNHRSLPCCDALVPYAPSRTDSIRSACNVTPSPPPPLARQAGAGTGLVDFGGAPKAGAVTRPATSAGAGAGGSAKASGAGVGFKPGAFASLWSAAAAEVQAERDSELVRGAEWTCA